MHLPPSLGLQCCSLAYIQHTKTLQFKHSIIVNSATTDPPPPTIINNNTINSSTD